MTEISNRTSRSSQLSGSHLLPEWEGGINFESTRWGHSSGWEDVMLNHVLEISSTGDTSREFDKSLGNILSRSRTETTSTSESREGSSGWGEESISLSTTLSEGESEE